MSVIDHIDGTSRRIFLHSDTVNVGLTSFESFYREYRQLRQDNASLQSFESFLKAVGNEPKGGDSYTSRYIKLLNGTRIVPYDTTHDLNITIELLTDEGTSGRDCFDRSTLSTTTNVNIDYQPKTNEIIRVYIGGSAMTLEEHNHLMALPTVTLTPEQDNKLMAIPEETLTTEEHDQLVGITTNGLLSEQRAKELILNRNNTISNRRIVQYVAGGDTTVDVTYDADGVPISEVIQTP